MPVISYLMFEGRCEEAMEFYKKAVGAEVLMLLRCKDAPPQPQGLKPGTEDKVLHTSFRIGGTVLGASDGMCNGNPEFKGISLTIEARDKQESERLFAGLSDGGQVKMPLAETFFSPSFGVVTDRFGVTWMVMIPRPM